MTPTSRAIVSLIGPMGLVVAFGWACTTFNFPPPGDAGTGDAGPEGASPEAGPDAHFAATLLSSQDGTLLCAELFRCPRLATAIELSLTIPLGTPSSPLGFSACMDWVTGPIDIGRVGLSAQQ